MTERFPGCLVGHPRVRVRFGRSRERYVEGRCVDQNQVGVMMEISGGDVAAEYRVSRQFLPFTSIRGIEILPVLKDADGTVLEGKTEARRRQVRLELDDLLQRQLEEARGEKGSPELDRVDDEPSASIP